MGLDPSTPANGGGGVINDFSNLGLVMKLPSIKDNKNLNVKDDSPLKGFGKKKSFFVD